MLSNLNSNVNGFRAVPNDIDLPTPIEFINQPDADINELRDRHENVQLSEARAFYASEPPPFLQPNHKKIPPGTRVRAQLADNGKLPARPLEVDVISRPWGNQGTYWTIDLESQRLIVKIFRGGTPAGGYRQWEGISKGFNRTPVAFKIFKRPNTVRASDSGRQSRTKRGSDEFERYNSHSRPLSARRSATQSATKVLRYCESTSSSSSSEDATTLPEVDDLSDASPALSCTNKVTELNPRITRRPSKIVKWHVSGDVANYLRKRKLSETKDIGSDLVQDFEDSFRRFMEPSQVSKSSFDMTFPPKRPKPNQSPELSILKVVQKPPDIPVGFVIEEISQHYDEKSDKFATTKPNGHHFFQTQTATPAISLCKQGKSTLCFFLPPDKDWVPIKLRSCMTMSTLFASAIGAFDLENQAEKLRALRATFADVPEGYPTVSLLIKRGLPDTFQTFLEVVDGLSAWDDGEKGTCTVKMEILMK